MKNELKKTYRKIRQIKNTKLNFGNKKQCYVCKNKFNHFGKYRNGSKSINEYLKNLQIIGSDLDNFNCHFCGSFDRIRHLFMYFDKLKLWEKFTNSRILHFAPETEISKKIKSLNPKQYIMGDLYPENDELQKIDITNIQLLNESIDILICNHVLEHVPDYKKAFQEIYRVLSKNGFAILQTPYSLLLSNNFEEENINTNSLRLFFYGQEDHVRFFSEKQFFHDLEKAGFELKIVKHADLFSDMEADYFGVNKKEDLIQVIKKQKTVFL